MTLEERIDSLASGWPLTKKRMFSGHGYMVNGNLAFGIHKIDELIVRTDKDLTEIAGVRPFDMGRGPMKNWFMAGSAAIDTDDKLLKLLEIGRNFAASLPKK